MRAVVLPVDQSPVYVEGSSVGGWLPVDQWAHTLYVITERDNAVAVIGSRHGDR